MTRKGKDHSDIQEIKELLKENLKETKESMKKLETDILQKVDKAIEEKLCKQSETQEKLESMMNEVKGVEVNIETKIRKEVQIFMDKHQEKEQSPSCMFFLDVTFCFTALFLILIFMYL